jgi:hypothetical protein
MKFFSIATILSLAVVSIAAPTVDIIERQTTSASSAVCKQEGGQQICCSSGASSALSLSGLLAVIPELGCE